MSAMIRLNQAKKLIRELLEMVLSVSERDDPGGAGFSPAEVELIQRARKFTAPPAKRTVRKSVMHSTHVGKV